MSDEAAVKRQAISGVKWISLSTVTTSAFQYIQVIVLTKLLLPSDFGLVAMALVVIGILQAFTDMGISNALIQRQNVTSEHRSSLYWLELATGLTIFFAMIVVTPYVVRFYREPPLEPVMLWVSTVFLVTSPGQMFQILLQKELEFRRLAVIDILSSLVSTVVTIVVAFLGFGAMSLVVGQVLFYGLRSLQFCLAGWKRWAPRLHFRLADLSGYLRFGLYQMGERTVTYLSINVINLIIGRYLGPATLGHYSLAYQLIITPVLRANTVLMSVSFPIFSLFQGSDEMLRKGYLHMTRLISFAIFPVLVIVFFTAPVFVPLLLGRMWKDVIPLIQILCAVGIARSLGAPTVPTYLAKGRADLGFFWNFFLAIINGIVFDQIVGYGIVIITLSFAVISVLQFILLQTITGNMIRLKWVDYLGSLSLNAGKNVALGLLLFGVYELCIYLHVTSGYTLVLMIAAGILFYTMASLLYGREFLREIWQFIAA